MTLWARSGGQHDPHLTDARVALIASLNGDLLEDFDGAPFPDEVQAAFAVRIAGLVPADAVPVPVAPGRPTWAHTAENDPAGLYDDDWEPKHADPVDAERLLIAWRRTKDFLRDRLVTSGRRDVNVNAVLREMNSAFDDPLAPNKP
jgi:hypothetical protein